MSSSAEPQPLRAIRTLTLTVLAFGLLGTGSDLVMLGHYEEAWQLAPLVLIAAALAAIAWTALTASPSAVIALQIVMVFLVAGGVVGVTLHYFADSEAAPPALAPASLVYMGLLGLVYTHRHPATVPDFGEVR